MRIRRTGSLKEWKKNRVRLFAFAAAAVLGASGSLTAYASAKSEAENKKNEAQANLDAQNEAIRSIEDKKDKLQAEVNKLDSDLVELLTTMGVLETEIADKQAELEETNIKLEETQKEERRQYAGMKERIRYMYERSSSSMLEIVLGATDFADFLNRIEYAKQVYGHDRELLTAYQETCRQIEEYKLQVEGAVAELNEMHAAYEEQETEYRAMITEKKKGMADFDTQLASAKELAQQCQSVITEQNEIIKQEEAKEEQARLAEEQRKADEQKKAEEQKKADEQKKNPGSTTTDNGKKDNTGTSSKGNKNPGYKTGVSGSQVVDYACRFIGNPYVLGGTSLTNGADCSGFVMSVYENFGVSLPHSSYALQSCGSEVSYENAQPGDLICYAGHVAIYMGGGQVVHASNSAPYPAGGIKTNSATYRSILTVRRVL